MQTDDSPTVDLLEHLPHAIYIVVVQKPSFRILVILLKWNTEGICDVDGLPVVLSKEDANYAFIRAPKH